jgi:hypothetical protein
VCDRGAGSLILMLVAFFPMTFLALVDGTWEAAALRLLVRVLEEPTPERPDAAPVESTLGAHATIGIAR